MQVLQELRLPLLLWCWFPLSQLELLQELLLLLLVAEVLRLLLLLQLRLLRQLSSTRR